MAGSKSVKIQGLRDLKTTLGAAEQRLAAEHRKESVDKRARQERAKTHLARERHLSGKKALLAKQIFEWGASFRKTREYAQLAKLNPVIGIFDASSVQIYSGGWGHKEPEYHKNDGAACWSKLLLNNNATFTYAFGYKWMGAQQRDLRDSQALAAGLSYDYLKTLKEALYSGEAIRKIASNLKRS